MAEASSDALTNILTELISFPTKTGDTKASKNCFGYIEGYLQSKKLVINSYESNGFASLVGTTKPTNQPKVLLQAHLDVVPADSAHFKLTEKNGRLYGRGVFDMKFAAACYLQLVEDLKNDLQDYDFGLMFTSDEEVGGSDGVGMLLDKGYSTQVCILPDGGDNWTIETGCNGLWIIRVKAKGQSAHGSRPWEGACAIDKLLDALTEIRKLFAPLGPNKSSLTISQISGGTAINQVADYAEATLDMRFVDDHQYKSKQASIQSITKASGLEVETIFQFYNCEVDVTNPYIAQFLKIAETVRGKHCKQARSSGGSDARFFAARNIPTIVIRPTGGGAHSENEWIDKAELLSFYEILKQYVTRVAKIKS